MAMICNRKNCMIMPMSTGNTFATRTTVASSFFWRYLLRSFVDDANTRWMYSGAMAVVLVNLVLVAYVIWCFVEGFPDADKAKATLRPGPPRPLPPPCCPVKMTRHLSSRNPRW
ncbi:unnamed protein product [Polarella glacialis]|uniref:Uncharacterized protein n=1 Tax=Polarella glacialis TaxID=89957 RepID=A0A813JA51_POLGL|nr:unnamed protein product [Polarella glacialis]